MSEWLVISLQVQHRLPQELAQLAGLPGAPGVAPAAAGAAQGQQGARHAQREGRRHARLPLREAPGPSAAARQGQGRGEGQAQREGPSSAPSFKIYEKYDTILWLPDAAQRFTRTADHK